jgi:archaellum component FlaG (FlaF/FlaG flagellin family)
MPRRLLAAVLVASSLAGCATRGGAAAPSQPTPTSSPVASPEVLPAATMGGTVTVRGNQPGESLQVQLVAIRDPASSPVVQPDPGHRFVGVQLAVRNVGTSTYHDSPSNGTAIFASDGQRYLADVLDAVRPGLGTLSLAPGAGASGFITFQVATDATLVRFNVTLDLGFGPQTGTWILSTSA